MDPVRNPFAPGAGSRPPELAGRDSVIGDAEVAIQRVLVGKNGRPQMLLGLRGVGKTVLLNKIQEIAERHGHVTSFIEAPERKTLAELLLPKINQILNKLSVYEAAKASTHAALRAAKSFLLSLKVTMGDFSIAVDPEKGVADSGDIESDLADLFVRIGEAAQDAGKAWTLLIDEVQYLSESDLSALIVAIHKISQKNLPVMFFGAGLPQTAALSGDAKSYAERLFIYPQIGALNHQDAAIAIRQPIEEEGAEIDDNALEEIIQKTHGYPYFLQEWGFNAWKVAELEVITLLDVQQATIGAIASLDEGFFKTRIDRLTPKEKEYVIAMAQLGTGPYRSSDVAECLKENAQSLGPRRAQIISKGMIYSPSHGDIDFTVPMFEEYLNRNFIHKKD
jgi:hypothetical protein